jgi:hypothetical protein
MYDLQQLTLFVNNTRAFTWSIDEMIYLGGSFFAPAVNTQNMFV